MSASNWGVCPMCISRAKELRKAFIEKYYGKLDSFFYNTALKEIDSAVSYTESYSGNKYQPNKVILEEFKQRKIKVKVKNAEYVKAYAEYDGAEILQQGKIGASLREDYEQGVDDLGFVYFTYSCECDCGFSKDIEYDEKKDKIIKNKGDET